MTLFQVDAKNLSNKNKQTIEEILEVLNTSETEFAKSTIETMNKMSTICYEGYFEEYDWG